MSQKIQTDSALAVTEEPTARALDQLSELQRAIAEARDIAETLPLRDKAAALRFLTRQIGLDRDIQNEAALACITAERKLGQLLAEIPKNEGGNPNLLHAETGSPLTYEEMGIDRTAAHRWQMMARLPDDKFVPFVDGLIAERRELTSGAVYQYARNVQGRIGGEAVRPLATIKAVPARDWKRVMDMEAVKWLAEDYVTIVVMPAKPPKTNGHDVIPATARAWNDGGWEGEDYRPEWLDTLS